MCWTKDEMCRHCESTGVSYAIAGCQGHVCPLGIALKVVRIEPESKLLLFVVSLVIFIMVFFLILVCRNSNMA